jgi:mono/diheme cytochrome c family protein
MKKMIVIAGITAFFMACSGNSSDAKKEDGANPEVAAKAGDDQQKKERDAKRGIGKFTNVEVSPALDAAKAEAGLAIYDMKCSSCHKLTDERLVGPGWKDVTTRRTPEWIMNFSTNPDEMLDKDPEAQAMLEICMIRMPNQSLSDIDARNVFEFMRKNDGVK